MLKGKEPIEFIEIEPSRLQEAVIRQAIAFDLSSLQPVPPARGLV